jgi:hypothetical protein
MSAERDREHPLPPRAAVYPPYVASEEERRRWDLCAALAEQLFADPEDGSARDVWLATRSLYRSDIPT